MMRVLTTVILVPVIVSVVLAAPYWLFLAVVAIIAVLCFREYSALVSGHGFQTPGPVGYAAGLLLLIWPRPEVAVVTVLALLAMTFALRWNNLAWSLPYAAALLLGVVYIFGGWRASLGLRALNPHWLMLGLALNWVGDTTAYFAGRAFGRHKLAPSISPAKSWEGSVASVAGSLAFGAFYLTRWLPTTPLVVGLALVAATNIAGQVGDLAESALKRGAGVKDSGSLLPGHGGWLDRVDSSLFGLPTLYFLLKGPWQV